MIYRIIIPALLLLSSCMAPKYNVAFLEKNYTTAEKVEQLRTKKEKLIQNPTAELIKTDRLLLENEFLLQYQNYIRIQEFEKARKLALQYEDRVRLNNGYNKKFFTEYYKEAQVINSKRDSLFSEILEKERFLKKVYKTEIGEKSEDEINNTLRLTELASIYAMQKNNSKLPLITKYKGFALAEELDLNTDYELNKVVGGGKKKFDKTLQELIDENKPREDVFAFLETTQKYAAYTNSDISPAYFEHMRKRLEVHFLEHGNDSSGVAEIKSLETIRTDTLNEPGVYSINGKILVITKFELESHDERVNEGKLIVTADKELLKYVSTVTSQLNKDKAKIKGGTALPYIIEHEVLNYQILTEYTENGTPIGQGRVIYEQFDSKGQTEKLLEDYISPVLLDEVGEQLYAELYTKKKDLATKSE